MASVMLLAATGAQSVLQRLHRRALLYSRGDQHALSMVTLMTAVHTSWVPVLIASARGLAGAGSAVPPQRLAEADTRAHVGGYLRPAARLGRLPH
jgi:hypothetical protein